MSGSIEDPAALNADSYSFLDHHIDYARRKSGTEPYATVDSQITIDKAARDIVKPIGESQESSLFDLDRRAAPYAVIAPPEHLDVATRGLFKGEYVLETAGSNEQLDAAMDRVRKVKASADDSLEGTRQKEQAQVLTTAVETLTRLNHMQRDIMGERSRLQGA